MNEFMIALASNARTTVISMCWMNEMAPRADMAKANSFNGLDRLTGLTDASDAKRLFRPLANPTKPRFSRRAVAMELRCIAEALRQGAPAKWSPDRHVRFREDIIARLERLAGEVRG